MSSLCIDVTQCSGRIRPVQGDQQALHPLEKTGIFDRTFIKPARPARYGVLLVLWMTALTGCTLAPEHARPIPPVPGVYPGQTANGNSIARIGWDAFFQEPQLKALIADALANNRDIRIAAGRVAEARAAYRIQGAALYPQLDAVATGTRSRTPADLSVTGRSQTGSQLHAMLSAGWEIDFWGRLRNLREAAREQYLATEEARRAVAISLVAQVASGYLLELEYAERIGLAARTIATREESLRILRRRYEVGSGSRLELTQAQVLLAQAQTALQGLEQERDINRNALALLVGKPVQIASVEHSLTAYDERSALPAGLPSQLLENRPDVVAAEHLLRAANADIGAARAAFFPNVALTGALGTASTELDGLFAGGSGSWNFTPSLSQPIFNAGRNAASLDLAKARRNVAVSEYERTVQSAFRDVADALVLRRQLAAQVATTQEMLSALGERARLANLRFEHGRSAYLEVLDAQRDLFGAEQALVGLRRGYLASGIALYAALGGGFPKHDDLSSANPASRDVK